MIFGILLSIGISVLPLIAGIVYTRAIAATAPPPMILRITLPEPPPPPTPAEPTPEPDEWDAFMVEITQAVESGRMRL